MKTLISQIKNKRTPSKYIIDIISSSNCMLPTEFDTNRIVFFEDDNQEFLFFHNLNTNTIRISPIISKYLMNNYGFMDKVDMMNTIISIFKTNFNDDIDNIRNLFIK